MWDRGIVTGRPGFNLIKKKWPGISDSDMVTGRWIAVTFFMALIFYHLTIFMKNAMFFKKAIKNQFWGYYSFEKKKKYLATKINITLFQIGSELLDIFYF